MPVPIVEVERALTTSAIDCCLSVADQMGVRVVIHTDTVNESGFV